MKSIHAHLQLSDNLDGHTRERCPNVIFSDGDTHLAAIRTDETEPELPLFARSINEMVIHDDALSRSIDEEAWLAEFSRVIEPGGVLRLTLPAEGVLAWLDTMNAYRYIADISGRGDAPDAALPTGWNRHYPREHVGKLMEDAGFGDVEIHPLNYALPEIRLMARMLGANWLKGDRKAESRLFPKLGGRDPNKRSGLLTTTWSVTARKR